MKDYGIDGFKFDGGTVHMYHAENVINAPVREDHDPYAMNKAWNEFGRRYTYHEYKDTYHGGGINCIQRLLDRRHRWTNGGIDTLIPCTIAQGLIGHPFTCPDMIGGGEWSFFHRVGENNVISEELFVRMAQVSALCPMMQFSWAPWRSLSEENLGYVVDAAKLHKKFAPEIIRLVKISETSGEPIVRSLEYNDPGKGYEMIVDQFMVGEDILVCPVVTPDTFKKECAFPEGTWLDEDGNEYAGGQYHVIDTPLSKLRYFVRKK
jgi:alpha-glucosidase (family GH31 glycosyl hydrolase)